MTWQQRHPERWKAYYAKWLAEHPGYRKEYDRKRHMYNPEKLNCTNRANKVGEESA